MCLAQGHSTKTELPRLGIEPGTPGFEIPDANHSTTADSLTPLKHAAFENSVVKGNISPLATIIFKCINKLSGATGKPTLMLIDWSLMPFLSISQLYQGGQFTYSDDAFPGFLTPVLHTIIFPSNWLLFHIDLAHWWKTNDACHIDFSQ